MRNNKSSIFIHSLFRSGSTYLFNVFRRSKAGYWCYQEALHELAVFAKRDKSILLVEHGKEKQSLLRHPSTDVGYFNELFEVWESWRDILQEEMIYDAYFEVLDPVSAGMPYWQALAEIDKDKVVFQECRTSGRISALKKCFDSYHIYLWRNPWDQWWSYKVAPYFDTANQIIATSKAVPDCLAKLCSVLNIQSEPSLDLVAKFSFYNERPLTSEHSYLLFYMLWCLALKEGREHADTMVNIDRLSECEKYRDNVLAVLKESADITDIDLSDCQVPQALYDKRDEKFFAALESQVHSLLLQHGWSEDDLMAIQKLRSEFQPAAQKHQETSGVTDGLTEQSSRARELARRYETELANRTRYFHQEYAQQANLKQALESKSQEDEAKAQEAEAKAQELDRKVHFLTGQSQAWESALLAVQKNEEVRAEQAERYRKEAEETLRRIEDQLDQVQKQRDESLSNAHHWYLRATEAEQQHAAAQQRINDLLHSTSWKITAPLRGLRRLIAWLLALPFRAIKALLRPLLNRVIRFALNRPEMRSRWANRLRKYPKVFAHLRQFAIKNGTLVVPSSQSDVYDGYVKSDFNHSQPENHFEHRVIAVEAFRENQQIFSEISKIGKAGDGMNSKQRSPLESVLNEKEIF